MEQGSLRVGHISKASASTRVFIDKLRKGEIKSLKTSKAKFNKTFLNGLDWWRILTVAGSPGAGKSTWLSEFRRDILSLNPDQDFDVLAFEFEMRMEDQLARDLSAKLGMTVKEIYSAEEPLSDEVMAQIDEILTETSNLPVFYVDDAGTVPEVLATIENFIGTRKIKDRDAGLVVTIDHSLITKGRQGESEKAQVDALYKGLVALKKYYSSREIRVTFVVLSQLNREIQSNERVTNPKLHYPTKNDLFASSAADQCSDYIIIIHRPATVSGMGAFYGPPRGQDFPNGFPVMCPTIVGRTMVYLHVLKERFGSPVIIPAVEDFKNNKIEEYSF